jgi:electron transfer flavoprotein alpha subunit
MSVIVYTENWEGKFKKSTFELLTYAKDTAKKLSKDLVVVSIGNVEEAVLKELAKYGASKIISYAGDTLKTFKTETYTSVLEKAAGEFNAELIIMPHSFNGKSVAPRLSGKLKAGLVSAVIDLVNTEDGFVVKKPVFSGKGFGYFKINTDIKILTLSVNSYKTTEDATDAEIEQKDAAISDDTAYEIKKVEKASGKMPLQDAEIVVSGGRGLKGPENWGMVEELAELLGAGTACSKPVSDMDWRPHSEHVGQTGITISPNLYIAIGISGAIQHLAGVSSSKVIVVINKDPEAPFFKSADYGIVGDAFEIVPKLIEAAKKLSN